MKKFLSITLLLTAMFLTFSACSSDDEDEVKLPDIVGIWFEATETPGDYVSMSTEVTWIFLDRICRQPKDLYSKSTMLPQENQKQILPIYEKATTLLLQMMELL